MLKNIKTKNDEFTEPSMLAKELARSLSVDKPLVIGIDGSTGSGKTILSYCLGCELLTNVINLDIFLNTKQGSFIDQIRYDDLSGIIKDKISSGKSIIVEGICLLKVLSKITVKQDILIYVKLISRNTGIWCEESDLSGNGEIDCCLEARLRNEIIEYHNEFNPLNAANYLFLRTE